MYIRHVRTSGPSGVIGSSRPAARIVLDRWTKSLVGCGMAGRWIQNPRDEIRFVHAILWLLALWGNNIYIIYKYLFISSHICIKRVCVCVYIYADIYIYMHTYIIIYTHYVHVIYLLMYRQMHTNAWLFHIHIAYTHTYICIDYIYIYSCWFTCVFSGWGTGSRPTGPWKRREHLDSAGKVKSWDDMGIIWE